MVHAWHRSRSMLPGAVFFSSPKFDHIFLISACLIVEECKKKKPYDPRLYVSKTIKTKPSRAVIYMHWDLQTSLRMSGDFASPPQPTRVKAQRVNQSRLEKPGLCRIMWLWVLLEFYAQSGPTIVGFELHTAACLHIHCKSRHLSCR